MFITYRIMTEAVEFNRFKSYEYNKKYQDVYYKKKYDTDDVFRKSEIERVGNNNKYKYKNDPEYRQKCKDNVKRYREKLKALDKDLEELKQIKNENQEFLNQLIKV